jgi:hypothetical protein
MRATQHGCVLYTFKTRQFAVTLATRSGLHCPDERKGQASSNGHDGLMRKMTSAVAKELFDPVLNSTRVLDEPWPGAHRQRFSAASQATLVILGPSLSRRLVTARSSTSRCLQHFSRRRTLITPVVPPTSNYISRSFLALFHMFHRLTRPATPQGGIPRLSAWRLTRETR